MLIEAKWAQKRAVRCRPAGRNGCCSGAANGCCSGSHTMTANGHVVNGHAANGGEADDLNPPPSKCVAWQLRWFNRQLMTREEVCAAQFLHACVRGLLCQPQPFASPTCPSAPLLQFYCNCVRYLFATFTFLHRLNTDMLPPLPLVVLPQLRAMPVHHLHRFYRLHAHANRDDLQRGHHYLQ